MITPEQFMAQPADPDEETEQESRPVDLFTPPTADLALGSIATSLRMLADIAVRQSAEEREGDNQRELVDQLDRELSEKQALIAKVLEVCKPSTSKLANAIREVLEPPAPVVEEPPTIVVDGRILPDVEADAPAGDAAIEDWRAYARAVLPDDDTSPFDALNRSQIRTLLGIAQPVAAG